MQLGITRTLSEVYEYRFVLLQLVRQQLVLRYRRTVLGYLWTLVNPLLMMSVTAVVFATLFKVGLWSYAIFLFAGMIPWNCFNSCVVQSSAAFIRNEGLIKKIYLPKILFPLSIVLGILIDSVLSFIALFLIILSLGGQLSWALLFLPLAFFMLFVFSLGMALAISVATVFFRDLQYVLTVAMQAFFFLSPILYDKDALAGKIAWLVGLNPIVPFIELFRSPLNSALLPSLSIISSAAALSVASLMIGSGILFAHQNKIVFRL